LKEPSDGELIAASRRDPRRFGLIFERHHADIHAYLRRRLGPEEADDLAAETFVRAFHARHRYDPERQSAKPWLFGIATNLLRRHWRRERRQLRAYARTGIDPVISASEEIENRLDASGAGPALASALASLPRGEREVLLLRAWAGLTDLEIAQAQGIRLGTVHSRLSRARRRMREAIRASGKGREDSTSAKGAGEARRRREWTSSSS
jgi:RNA polymerase sigma factor (sigma-70 family)